MEVEEKDKEKNSILNPKGSGFNQILFGLTNAPATFQCLMECILAGITDDECLIYIDDIIVFSQSFEEHLQRLRHVFQRLQIACLKLKPEKCKFAQKKVLYLQHVSAEGVQTDSEKMSQSMQFQRILSS